MLDDDLRELMTAEDFLTYFGIAFDPHAVAIHRMPILRRFHDLLSGQGLPHDDEPRRAVYASLLEQAYRDCQLPRPRPAEGLRTAGASVSFVPLAEIWNQTSETR